MYRACNMLNKVKKKFLAELFSHSGQCPHIYDFAVKLKSRSSNLEKKEIKQPEM